MASNARRMARMLAAEMAKPLQPVRSRIDWGALERLEAYAAERMAEMTPERREQLRREWNHG